MLSEHEGKGLCAMKENPVSSGNPAAAHIVLLPVSTCESFRSEVISERTPLTSCITATHLILDFSVVLCLCQGNL